MGDCEFSNRTYSFIVDQDIHQITFNLMDDWFQIDRHRFLPPQNMSFHSIAVISLDIVTGLGDTRYVQTLANALDSMNYAIKSVVAETCRRHMVHGGVGLLAEEDFQNLKADSCCDEVAEELFMFYLGHVPA